MPGDPLRRAEGLARGVRIFTNATVSAQRAALALGIDPYLPPIEALKEWRTRRSKLVMHKPATVKDGPLLENSRKRRVDLGTLPGAGVAQGRRRAYIGSGSIVVMRDPVSGWVNASIYRVQVHEKSRVTVQFDHQGRHGAIIAQALLGARQAVPRRGGERAGSFALHRRLRVPAGRRVGVRLRRRDPRPAARSGRMRR